MLTNPFFSFTASDFGNNFTQQITNTKQGFIFYGGRNKLPLPQ